MKERKAKQMQASLRRDTLVSRYRITNKRITGAMHYHNEHEFYYMIDGNTTFIIDGEIYSVEKGNFVFVPKGVPHMTDNQNILNTVERFLLSFDEGIFTEKYKYILDALAENRIIHVPDTIRPTLEKILYKIETEYKQDEKGRDELMNAYILELMILIYRHRYKKKTQIRESDKIIYDVSDYIMSHYSEDINLKSLSKTFNISEGYLSRKFKEVSGLCINQYITYVRINNAKKFLEHSKFSVTQIADMCGFCGSTYFSSVFKKFEGIAPLAFRKQRD